MWRQRRVDSQPVQHTHTGMSVITHSHWGEQGYAHIQMRVLPMCHVRYMRGPMRVAWKRYICGLVLVLMLVLVGRVAIAMTRIVPVRERVVQRKFEMFRCKRRRWAMVVPMIHGVSGHRTRCQSRGIGRDIATPHKVIMRSGGLVLSTGVSHVLRGMFASVMIMVPIVWVTIVDHV